MAPNSLISKGFGGIQSHLWGGPVFHNRVVLEIRALQSIFHR
jgi:hypothetical protein